MPDEQVICKDGSSDPKPFRFGYAALAITPLLLTPLVVFTLAEAWVDFGGGEKDILLALPYVVLGAIFFITALILILKRWKLRRWLVRSCAVSAGALISIWLVAYAASWLVIE